MSDATRTIDQAAADALHALVDSVGAPPDWDVLLFPDGSGSTWERGAGWGCVGYDRRRLRLALPEERIWAGLALPGSVNFAEMMAVLQPLAWLQAREERLRGGGGPCVSPLVVVVSDSQYVVQGCTRTPRTNTPLWGAIAAVRHQGLRVEARWLRRNEAAGNALADRISKRLGRTAKQLLQLMSDP